MKAPFAKLSTWRGKGGVRPWLYLPFVFFSYAVLDLALRYTYRGLGMLGFRHPAAHLLTLGWCLILTAIACALPGRWKKAYLLVSIPLFAVLTAAHSVLRHLFRRFFMFSTLSFAQDGLAFADAQYIQIAPPVLLGIALSLLSLLAALFLAPGRGEQRLRTRAIPALLGAAFGLVLIFGVQRVYFSSDHTLAWDNYSDPAAVYESFTDSTATLLMAGLYQYTLRDLSFSLAPSGKLSAQEAADLENYAAARQLEKSRNSYSGIFAGKNLILIQLEAIDTWMLTPDYMPSLSAIKEESMVFENHYSPAYITAGTLNTEFIANTGLLPAMGSVSTKVYERNSYPFSLANRFRAAGYSAESFHGSEGNIYNRGTFHPAIGYESYHSGKDMGMEDYTMDRHLIEGYADIVRPSPFLSFLITYSGHGPYGTHNGAYRAHGERAWAQAPEGEEGNYIFAVAGAMETDLFIDTLISRLEADGVLENTVLVFYADHYNYYMMNDMKNMEIKGVDQLNLLQHTDFFIYSKDHPPARISKPTSSLDILPTLANLFGLPDEGALYLGNDAFSDAGGWVFFSDNSWLDGERYWDYSAPATELSAARAREIAEILRMGSLLLQSDYFARSR